MPETTEPTQTQTPPSVDSSSQQPSQRAPGEPFEIPVLALQNLTLFPETVVPLGVGRPRSMAAVDSALLTEEKLLACITVRPEAAGDGDASTSDLFQVGTLVMIKRMERTGDAMRIIVQGTERLRVVE